MHVVLGVLGEVVVEDVGHPGDVEAAGGHVGRNQDRDPPAVEPFEEGDPPPLRDVAREHRGREPVAFERGAEAIRHVAGVDEHHRPLHLGLAKQSEEQGDLLVLPDMEEPLRHFVDDHPVRRTGIDQGRLVHMLVRELEHPLREGRGKEEAQPVGGGTQAPEQVADVADEAEVEHPVRLVENEHLHGAQVVEPLPVVVDEAPGGPDEDVEPLLDHAPLPVVAGAPVDDPHGEPGMAADGHRVLVDLDGELAGGSDDVDSGPARRSAPAASGRGVRGGLPSRLVRRSASARHFGGRSAAQDPVHGRDEKGRGLAGPGPCLSRNVAAGEGERKGLGLDRGAAFESRFLHPLEKRRNEPHVLEPCVGKDAGRAGRIGLVGPLAITVQVVSNGTHAPSVNGRKRE